MPLLAGCIYRCQPEITESAAEDLVAGYLQMRRNGVSKKTITATPRQLESLVRTGLCVAQHAISLATSLPAPHERPVHQLNPCR